MKKVMQQNEKQIQVEPGMMIPLGELSAIEINMIQQGLNYLPHGQVRPLIEKISVRVQKHISEVEKPKKK
jgi:hypothetical protein